MKKIISIVLLLTICFACGARTDDIGIQVSELSASENRPTGKMGGVRNQAARASKSPGIQYRGGPIMLGTTKIYYIWYGNWNNNTATSILTDFANNIGGSQYFNINTTYYDSYNAYVSNSVIFAGSIIDSYSKGTNLSDADIAGVVTDALKYNLLPTDSNAVYFVLTSADVNASSGFCTSYCGWHNFILVSNTNIKYSFVGNPDRCPSACEAQNIGPNGNAGADGMASIIAHELEEAVTDPNLNAWYDRRGYENADKCAWTFGTTYTVNGAKANMLLGTKNYLIQQNWVNLNGGYCDIKL